MINEILNIKVDTYDGPKEDRGYDFSMLNSINTCPFYGIVRHIHNKVFDNTSRNMALECGDLCHKCYACYRALSIYYRGITEKNSIIMNIGMRELIKVFVKTIDNISEQEAFNFVQDCLNRAKENATLLASYTIFSDFLIDNSGYYEDPEDKKRTIENIKASMLAYCSNFLEIILKEPVWIEDINDPNSRVGIEVQFNIKILITFDANGYENVQDIHFIGAIDGIHVREDGTLIIHENKTASRLDDSWAYQWYKSHQITGYCLIAGYFIGNVCYQARVLGMQIPVPKYSGYAFRTERVDRQQNDFSDWARWVLFNHQIIEDYKNEPEKAPMNTHACCKYYKACAFLPLCVENTEERKRIINEEMLEQPWSPLDE